MAGSKVRIQKCRTIWNELDQLHHAIARRAYELFHQHGERSGHAVDDWIAAEHQVVWKPAIELRDVDGRFVVEAALAGVDPKQLEVLVSPTDLLIKAEVAHEHRSDTGVVHVCEFSRGPLRRSVHFPAEVDPDTASATYQHGLLRVSVVPPRKTVRKKVEVVAG